MKAIFLWKENESSDTVEMMLPLCMERARELGWQDPKLFTEGFGPGQNWEHLLSLAAQGTLTGVILHNLGKWHDGAHKIPTEFEVFTKNNVQLSLVLMDYRTTSVDVLRIIADSSTYYSRLRSQSIRSGMRVKKGGRPPYGMEYNEEGHLTKNADWEKVVIVFNLKSTGMAVSDIAKMTSLTPRKVRSILDTHESRFSSA